MAFFRLGSAAPDRTVRPESDGGYLYLQRWNESLRTAMEGAFLSSDECRNRWDRGGEDEEHNWFTVVPASAGVGAFSRDAEGLVVASPTSRVPAWIMEVFCRGGVASAGPAMRIRRHDEAGRIEHAVTASNRWDGRLFVDRLTTLIYPDPTERAHRRLPPNRVILTENIYYDPAGTGVRTISNRLTREFDREEYDDVPIDELWHPAPLFGRWEALASTLSPVVHA
jgi:hypothetical protein